jgi:hypothetical protein
MQKGGGHRSREGEKPQHGPSTTLFALCDFSRAAKVRNKVGLKSLRENSRIWKPEGRTADPSATLRSGRDDNSSWKLYLAFPNKIVIPTGA